MMPRWSGTSWIQWMNSLRPPGSSFSIVYGAAPAKTSTGARPRRALLIAPPMFWVPASTCTMTACGERLTSAAACAALSATISCGQTMSRGRSLSLPSAFAWASASIRPGWSLPRFAKMYCTPASASASRNAVLVV